MFQGLTNFLKDRNISNHVMWGVSDRPILHMRMVKAGYIVNAKTSYHLLRTTYSSNTEIEYSSKTEIGSCAL